MQASEAQLRALMLAGLAGDAPAYRALLDQLRRRLSVYFGRRLNNPAEVEDLVQETLIAVHTKRATYDPDLPFTAWVYAMARYKLIDHYRRSGRRITVPLEDAGELFVEDESGAVEARHDIEVLLGELTPRSRELIRSVKIEQLSTAEAAARAGMSETAVKVAVHRGLQRLAAKVRGKPDE